MKVTSMKNNNTVIYGGVGMSKDLDRSKAADMRIFGNMTMANFK